MWGWNSEKIGVCGWTHMTCGVMADAANSFRLLHPTSRSYIQSMLVKALEPWYAVDGHICAPYCWYMPLEVGVHFWKIVGMADSEWFCNVVVDAPKPHRLHPTSISCWYKVFSHIDILWMGIRLHPYTVTVMHVRLKFWESWGYGWT